jgi:hypothetical protein
MDLADIGPRPLRGHCLRCKRSIRIEPNGRPRLYCSNTCRHFVYRLRKRQPKLLPVEDKQRALLWDTLSSWGIVSGPMPKPMPKQDAHHEA